MARFTLTIVCDNDAFVPNAEVEVSRILRQAAYRVDMGHVSSNLVDANGNTVGKFTTITGEDVDENGCDFDSSGWCGMHMAACVGGKAAILAAL